MLFLLRDTTHFLAIFVKKTLPWKPSICDVVNSDLQVRMRDSKTRQHFVEEKVEKLYWLRRSDKSTCVPDYKSCANRTADPSSLPLVAANNTTITTYGSCKRIVDVGLKRDYAWTCIHSSGHKTTYFRRIIGPTYSLLVDLKGRCSRDMRTVLAIQATLSSIKPLSLNKIDSIRNEYT